MMRKKGGSNEWRQVRNMDALESENDSYIDDLEARVQGLKEVGPRFMNCGHRFYLVLLFFLQNIRCSNGWTPMCHPKFRYSICFSRITCFACNILGKSLLYSCDRWLWK